MEWEDSNSHDGWASELPRPALCRSVGYEQVNDERGITITTSLADDEQQESPYQGALAIPRSAVRKVRVLRR